MFINKIIIKCYSNGYYYCCFYWTPFKTGHFQAPKSQARIHRLEEVDLEALRHGFRPWKSAFQAAVKLSMANSSPESMWRNRPKSTEIKPRIHSNHFEIT